MTTRRGFIQGVLVGMVALVLPKTAEVSESDEPSVKLEHVIALDGMDSFIWPEHWSDGDYVFSDDIDGIDHITVELNDCTRWSPEITGDGSGIALPEVSSAKLYGPGHIDWIHFPECSIGELADE